MKAALWFFIQMVLLSSAFGQTRAEASSRVLFESREILELRLIGPISDFARSRDKAKTFSMNLEILGQENLQVVPVEVRVRGHYTLGSCELPKMEISVNAAEAKGTVFEGYKKFDLNTHCTRPVADGRAWVRQTTMARTARVHREAVAYELLNVLEYPAFRARRVNIQYEDTSEEKHASYEFSGSHQALVKESANAFEKRFNGIRYFNQGDILQKKQSNPLFQGKVYGTDGQASAAEVLRLRIFEFFIENGDFYDSGSLHNVRAYQRPDGRMLLIPHDFNFSNLSMGPGGDWFSGERPLSLSGVSPEEWAEIKDFYLSKRDELLSLTGMLEGDSEAQQFLEQRVEALMKRISDLSNP